MVFNYYENVMNVPHLKFVDRSIFYEIPMGGKDKMIGLERGERKRGMEGGEGEGERRRLLLKLLEV